MIDDAHCLSAWALMGFRRLTEVPGFRGRQKLFFVARMEFGVVKNAMELLRGLALALTHISRAFTHVGRRLESRLLGPSSYPMTTPYLVPLIFSALWT
jgi:hypothetical protein